MPMPILPPWSPRAPKPSLPERMPRHAETRLVPYTPAQMFDLVADVARYPEFLPWCVGARVTDRIGEPLPRLDANEPGTGLGPNAQSGEVGKIYLKLWTDLCPVGHASADKPIENEHIRNEQLIPQCERVTHDRGRQTLG